MRSFFKDKTFWDGETKTAISVRDGVLEYMGYEIGAEEPNKIYTVYRSPATISNTASKMVGIPLTDDHVDLDSIPDGVGIVKKAEMIDYFEDGTNSNLAIKNVIDLSNEIIDTIGNGKKELSLGYNAKLVPHMKYDFEQRDIEPHHLAIVSDGRCGHGCSFLDSGKAITLHKLFCDEDGKLNLSKIAEIAMALPDAIGAMPIDELSKIMPKLQEIVEASKSKDIKDQKNKEGGMPENEKDLNKKEDKIKDQDPKEDEVKDQDPKEEDDKNEKDVKDQDPDKDDKKDTKDQDEEKEGEDKDEKKQDAKDAKVNICDTVEFKDAVAAAVAAHGAVISKAVDFVDEGYDFAAKTTDEIMSDAVATQYNLKDMAPEEIKVAFKLLKKESNYKNFGDQNVDDVWSKLSEKEL